MTRRWPLSLPFILTQAVCTHEAYARSPLQRDVEGYAVATCLARQPSPYLKQQANGWGSAIVQRGHGGLEPLRAVAAAVVRELAHTPVPMARDEEHPMQPTSMPVQFCAEIIDRPAVRQVIDTTLTRLGPAYQVHPGQPRQH